MTDLTESTIPDAPWEAVAESLPSYCYPEQYKQVMKNISNHEMTVLHEDGNYRHLRFKNPHRSMWFFDIITWPGTLVIRGDIGDSLMFSRVPNMLAFFDDEEKEGHINPGYWADKLERGMGSVLSYSEDKFCDLVDMRIRETIETNELDEDEATEFRGKVQADVLFFAHNEHEAINALTYFSWHGEQLAYDLDVRAVMDYDHHFILACHALLWGVKKYHATHGRDATGE